jgi:hypothetical protein
MCRHSLIGERLVVAAAEKGIAETLMFVHVDSNETSGVLEDGADGRVIETCQRCSISLDAFGAVGASDNLEIEIGDCLLNWK